MHVVLGCVIGLVGVAGVAMQVLTLPGMWLTIAVALVLKIGAPLIGITDGLYSWKIFIVAVGFGVIAEAIEFFLSSAAAKAAGGGKAAMLAAPVCAIIGAVMGTFGIPVPVIGTLLGATLGAGAGAAAAQWWWTEVGAPGAMKVGVAAAAGQAAVLVIKAGIAVIVAGWLTIAAFVPGPSIGL